jgi:hypothetical protein
MIEQESKSEHLNLLAGILVKSELKYIKFPEEIKLNEFPASTQLSIALRCEVMEEQADFLGEDVDKWPVNEKAIYEGTPKVLKDICEKNANKEGDTVYRTSSLQALGTIREAYRAGHSMEDLWDAFEAGVIKGLEEKNVV